jgi:GntR family transcriptional regulator, N-acetylglucosamine utilization regulator
MAKTPDRSLPNPLYAQIKEILFERIRRAEWQPGTCIPTETELCQSFGVSRITVRRALSELVSEGYLERISGRGTFVSQPPINQSLKQLTSFTQDMQRRGQRPGAVVLSVQKIAAGSELATKLGIIVGETIILLKRLRLANDEPLAVETAHLPSRYFDGLEDEDLEGRSLYKLMRERFGIVPTRAVQKISAGACPDHEAELLYIPKKSPVLHIFRTTYDQAERVVEAVESFYRGDKYVFQAELVVEE